MLNLIFAQFSPQALKSIGFRYFYVFFVFNMIAMLCYIFFYPGVLKSHPGSGRHLLTGLLQKPRARPWNRWMSCSVTNWCLTPSKTPRVLPLRWKRTISPCMKRLSESRLAVVRAWETISYWRLWYETFEVIISRNLFSNARDVAQVSIYYMIECATLWAKCPPEFRSRDDTHADYRWHGSNILRGSCIS